MLRKLRLRPKPREDGPVFISYRRSDGASYVDLIETFLWAGGIAPWRDIIDLPAGETDMRIREAFRQGISAAILVVTPEIGDSEFVPRVELPALLALDRGSDNSALGSQVPQAENQFRLYIVNTIPKPGKSANASLEVDHTAPDRLLRTGRRFRLHGLRSGQACRLLDVSNTRFFLATRRQFFSTCCGILFVSDWRSAGIGSLIVRSTSMCKRAPPRMHTPGLMATHQAIIRLIWSSGSA